MYCTCNHSLGNTSSFSYLYQSSPVKVSKSIPLRLSIRLWLFHLKDRKYRLEIGILLERNFGDEFKTHLTMGNSNLSSFYLQFDNFYGLTGVLLYDSRTF